MGEISSSDYTLQRIFLFQHLLIDANRHFALSYINNPLLLRGKKFDVRSFLLIACTSPYMVFFRHGYVRLTCDVYDPDSSNLTAHLTNQVDFGSYYSFNLTFDCELQMLCI